jgi:hypothetical protein
MNQSYIKAIIAVVIVLILAFVCKYVCQPRLSGNLRNELEKSPVASDSLIDDRDMGLITLHKFADKVKKTGRCEVKLNKDKDSVEFIIKKEDHHIFYAGNSFEKMRKFKNLPVNIKPNGSFVAEIIFKTENDSTEYIKIPYQILFSLVKNMPENSHTSLSKAVNNEPSKITIKSAENLDFDSENKLIQTEGLVFNNVSDIIAQNGHTSGNKYEQITVLWKYTYNNWNYINDPNIQQTGEDRWRSATQTIENYYFSKPHKYSGDCDDFAILMASFARQVGLRSRFVCAIGNGGGHAYAEFFVPNNEESEMKSKLGNVNSVSGNGGIWVNMDWWGNEIGGTYFNGNRIKEIENL